MEIILKEKIKNLGNIGDIVKVKRGYAKNFLIPANKALYATKANIELLNQQKAMLEQEGIRQFDLATEVANHLQNKAFIFIRSASESGMLYGSVNAKNIVESLSKGNIHIKTYQLKINEPIKTIGTYNVVVQLHSDVATNIVVVVARSAEDAENMYTQHMEKLQDTTVEGKVVNS